MISPIYFDILRWSSCLFFVAVAGCGGADANDEKSSGTANDFTVAPGGREPEPSVKRRAEVTIDIPANRASEMEASYRSEGYETRRIVCSHVEAVIYGVCLLATQGRAFDRAELLATSNGAMVEPLVRDYRDDGYEVLVNGLDEGFSCGTFNGSSLRPYPHCVLAFKK